MKKLIAASAAVGMLVAGVAVAAPAQAATKSFALGVLQDVNGWNPNNGGTGNATPLYQAVYDTLFLLDKDAIAHPHIATGYKYDKTFTKLTLTLRTGLTFTDGAKLDAAAVAANLNNTRAGACEACGRLSQIASVKATNATTLLVTLKAPDPGLIANLGGPSGMLASPKAIKAGTLTDWPTGSGPYILSKDGTVKGSKYVFNRNPKYWNKKLYSFDQVSMVIAPQLTAMVNALASGQIDAGNVSDVNQIPPLLSRGMQVQQFATADVQGLYFWDRTGALSKPLGDVRVRQAINYALDRDTIMTKAYMGLGWATQQVFARGGQGYMASLDHYYSYDPAKAKALLSAAGYADGFTLEIPTCMGGFPKQCAAIVEMLGKVGITVKLLPRPALAQYLSDLLAGKYASCFMPLNAGTPWVTIAQGVDPKGTWNPLHTNDAALNALAKKARTSTGAAQTKYLQQINTKMVKDAWNAPISQSLNNFVYSKKLDVTMQAFIALPSLYLIKAA